MGETGSASARRRPWLAHPLAVVALAVFFLAPVALLGADAASDKPYPEAVSVLEWKAQIVAAESVSGSGPDRWRVSADGGLTWRPTSPDELGLTDDHAEATLPTRACAPDQPSHCYRTVPGHLRVEESLNGGHSWWIAWSVPDDERRRLARCYEGLGEPAEHLSSRALAVVPVADGHAVVVANGRDGYVVRAPDGTWTRTGFGTTIHPSGAKARPAPPIEGPSARDAAPQIVAGLFAGLAVMAVAGSAAAWRVARWSVGAAAGLLGVGGLVALAGGFGWRDTNAVLPVLVLVSGLVAAAAGAFGVLVIAARRRAARKLTAALAAVIGIAVAAADAGLFAAWAHGAVGYRSAAFAAQALAVLGLIVAVTLVVRLRPGMMTRRAQHPPPDAELTARGG